MSSPFRRALRDLRLKSTPQRLAILEFLAAASTYVSPEEVWHNIQATCVRVGLPTVYRNLEELANGGVISKVIHPNRQLYYFFCANHDHHHHFICLSCRRVADVAFCGIDAVEQEVHEQIGGRVLSHIVQVNGLCQACLTTDAATAPCGGY
jgi:Fe2+ or Zn2+ uptake regulation protein